MNYFLKRLCFVFIVAACTLGFSSVAFAYENPIILPNEWKWDTGVYYGSGDPYILKHNGVYYLYVSTVDDKSGIKVWSSNNLVNWTYEGLCATDSVTKAAYAPEVVYWNGYFYMYTSPGGNGHYVLRSDSPTGPFKVKTGNLGHTIDGHVFIDDDGQWYFYNASDSGIVSHPMTDPYTIGKGTTTGSYMGGWTEGATLLKRNGLYYMTYTGNHVWNRGYRVNYSTSGSPITNFVPSSENPALINTEGPVHGTGHNSMIIGPDLDTYYMVYHSQADPGRHFNLDKVVWNGKQMDVLGPTSSEQPDPDMPTFRDDFSDPYKNKWSGIKISNLTSTKKHNRNPHNRWEGMVSKSTTENNFSAEFNLLQLTTDQKGHPPDKVRNPGYGVVFAYQDNENYGVALINKNDHRLQTQFVVNGEKQGWEHSPLPDDYDYNVLHNIRVKKDANQFKVFIDGMLKQTRNADLDGGKIGYMDRNTNASFGYIAFSNKVNGSGAWDTPKPVPGEIDAVHYMSGGEGVGYHDKSNDNIGGMYRHGAVDIRLNHEGGYNVGWNQTGEWLKYKVNVAETGTYDVDLRVATTFNDAKIRIWSGTQDLTGVVDVPNTGGWNDWETFTIKNLPLEAGVQELKVEIVEGEYDFKSMAFKKGSPVPAITHDFNDGNDDGWKRYEGDISVENGKYIIGGNYAKALTGKDSWSDYTIETDVVMKDSDGKSGILVRSTNPADGSHLGNFKHFNQGYFAYITTNGVYLGKENYGWTYLTGVATSEALKLNKKYHLKVVVNGTNIKVYLDDMDRPLIDYDDNSSIPFTHGKAGVRTSNGTAVFDNFEIYSH
ncbi:family 43 glycosylhydrolase [Virgibacillus siamensis]|uniref:family 43 glycosylhydrolase n=1 Tax=Virgibacillus siamensis TaxID=480071 RepID=UPI000985CBD2|nr:family 43 glycosylhydrolase [Virgibacillus siamensis]